MRASPMPHMHLAVRCASRATRVVLRSGTHAAQAFPGLSGPFGRVVLTLAITEAA
jgi:hypothetical protein